MTGSAVESREAESDGMKQLPHRNQRMQNIIIQLNQELHVIAKLYPGFQSTALSSPVLIVLIVLVVYLEYNNILGVLCDYSKQIPLYRKLNVNIQTTSDICHYSV